MWVEPRGKEGDRKATGSWSTMEVYYPPVSVSSSIRDEACDLQIAKRTIDISRSGNCQYIVTSLHTAMRMPTNHRHPELNKEGLMPIPVPVATSVGIRSALPPVFSPSPLERRGRIGGSHFVAHSVISIFFPRVNSSFMFSSLLYLISKVQYV